MKQPGNRYRKDTVGHTKESGGKQTEIMDSTNKKQIEKKHQEYTGGMKQIEYTGSVRTVGSRQEKDREENGTNQAR